MLYLCLITIVTLYVYIIVIFHFYSGQNNIKLVFLALQHSEVWEILILAPPNINCG